MRQLNARVDVGRDGEFNTGDEEDPAVVARDWLVETNLVDPANLPPIADVRNFCRCRRADCHGDAHSCDYRHCALDHDHNGDAVGF